MNQKELLKFIDQKIQYYLQKYYLKNVLEIRRTVSFESNGEYDQNYEGTISFDTRYNKGYLNLQLPQKNINLNKVEKIIRHELLHSTSFQFQSLLNKLDLLQVDKNSVTLIKQFYLDLDQKITKRIQKIIKNMEDKQEDK